MPDKILYTLVRPALFSLDPEAAHNLTLPMLRRAAALGLTRAFRKPRPDPRTVMGITFPNPVGLAAGLDKDGAYIDGLAALGFGSIEIGTVTPRGQAGNPKPRMFRLPQADALEDLLSGMGRHVDAVIEIRVDDAALVDRISGRYTCGNCGEVYHDTTRPTAEAGRCDICGSTDLRRRADDNADSLRTRLLEYYKKTSPLIGYYYAKKQLHPVDGMAEMDEVGREVAAVLDGAVRAEGPGAR